MFTHLTNARKALIFTILVLALAVGFSFIPGMSTTLYMFTPAIAALLMMLVITKEGYSREGWKRLGFKKPAVRSWPVCLIVPVIPLVLSYLAAWGMGMSKLEVPDQLFGFGWSVIPLVLVLVYVKAVFFESLGEELGWRGYLLPNMLRMGERKAMLVSGFIHGVWHAPLILNTSAYHADENVWILFPLMVLSTTFLGPFIGLMRLKTGSVLAASMIHTTHNMVWAVLAALYVNTSETAKYISGDMSVVVVVFYIGLTLWLWRKPGKAASAV